MSKLLYVAATLALFLSCSPKRTGPGDDDDDGSNGNNGSNGIGSACASDIVKAGNVPLDIYIMLDQSSDDRHGRRWQQVDDGDRARSRRSSSSPTSTAMSVGMRLLRDRDLRAAPPAPTTMHRRPPTAARPRAVRASKAAASAPRSSRPRCTAATRAPRATTRRQRRDRAAARRGERDHELDRHATRRRPARRPSAGVAGRARSRDGVGARTHAGDAVVAVLATDGEPERMRARRNVPTSTRSPRLALAAHAEASCTFVIGVTRHRQPRRTSTASRRPAAPTRRSSSTPAATSTSSSSTR